MHLEGQVVSTTLACRFLSRREGRSSISRLSKGSALSRSGSYGSGTTNHIESTDIIEPTSVELMSIDVEGHGKVLAHLNIELFDAVLTEHTEDTLLGILSRNLYHIILRHP